MDVATISLFALLVTIVVSCTMRLHVGILAIALAWLVGLYAGIALAATSTHLALRFLFPLPLPCS